MTRSSIREYTGAVRGRYLRASKKEKSRILDEFTQVTGYHRKAAIRLLRRGNQPKGNKRRLLLGFMLMVILRKTGLKTLSCPKRQS